MATATILACRMPRRLRRAPRTAPWAPGRPIRLPERGRRPRTRPWRIERPARGILLEVRGADMRPAPDRWSGVGGMQTTSVANPEASTPVRAPCPAPDRHLPAPACRGYRAPCTAYLPGILAAACSTRAYRPGMGPAGGDARLLGVPGNGPAGWHGYCDMREVIPPDRSGTRYPMKPTQSGGMPWLLPPKNTGKDR